MDLTGRGYLILSCWLALYQRPNRQQLIFFHRCRAPYRSVFLQMHLGGTTALWKYLFIFDKAIFNRTNY